MLNKSAAELSTIVRLQTWQIAVIQKAFQASFLPDDHLWLFGSRVYLNKRGGDIDLYIETHYKDAASVVKAQSNFHTEMIMKLGEQKIDIVVKYNQTDLLIYKVAQKEGIQLV